MRLLLRGVPLDVKPGAILTFKVSLANATDEDREITLPTSKRFDLVIRNLQGAPLLDYNQGRMFLQTLTPMRVGAGSEVHLGDATFEMPPETPPGTYAVEAHVKALDGEWRERVTFDVKLDSRPRMP